MPSSSTVCVDASLVVCYVLDDQADEVDAAWRGWLTDGVSLHAPTLLFYEVVTALHRLATAGIRGVDSCAAAFAMVSVLPIELHGDIELHRQAFDLAREHSLAAAYDAHYLAVARRLDAPLWTCDARLAKAVGDWSPGVILVS
ncbi:MAG: type II toxin-antitoxin system VapC family toxin [Pseudonocardiales bacterium]|nr:type II toxin-antitoxin system VapC family toxin [Pseudonocardiales bacterium]